MAFDQLAESSIYGNIIYPQAEGYTLRSLLEEEVAAEPSYIRLIRDDFIRSYNPDRVHARLALQAFQKYVLETIFIPGRKLGFIHLAMVKLCNTRHFSGTSRL
jgi:hypothetical protein